MRISELRTPVPLLDLEVVDRNLHRVVDLCHASGVQYRPHIKTHKIPALAQAQIDAGARGITCAKVGEAEVMAAAGLRDIFIAYTVVGKCRLERLLKLSAEATISVGVDSLEGASGLSEFFHTHGRKIDVLLEVDTGHHRCGVLPNQAVVLALEMMRLPGIRLRGIFTHEGHVYASGTKEERLGRARQAGQAMSRLADELRRNRIPAAVVSVGSSPALDAACAVEGVTENRPGTSILNDATQVYLGACNWEDCAVHYLCTVVSHPAPDRIIIDGGSKTFTSDHLADWQDYGHLIGCAGAHFRAASEEHGIISLDHSNGLGVGEQVRVIPSHVCGSINLHDRIYAVRGNTVIDEWKVEARGRVD